MRDVKIRFNQPPVVGTELGEITKALEEGKLAGNGSYTHRCHEWFESQLGVQKALLTHSCTAALEMAALLFDFGPDDEVILPSYTFVSTANAFALRGAKLKFIDIREDTLNIDESLLDKEITGQTKAICPVHYAGIGCEMDAILKSAQCYNVPVVEDAAQAMCSRYKNRNLGTIGELGCYSFHETKNIVSGEGGVLLINDERFIERAEIIREKGTNRSQFFRGQTDKYTWVDIGSSYLPSELVAAFLYAQLNAADRITDLRVKAWQRYQSGLRDLEEAGHVRLPVIPEHTVHNGHMFYMLMPSEQKRNNLLNILNREGINAVFHYIPLHSSPMGIKLSGGKVPNLPVTDDLSARLIRLPLYVDIDPDIQERIINIIKMNAV